MPSRPNILWIVTTQWRAQAIGYAGDPNARTPWLDALAGEAVNFCTAVTPHPFGPQARAALLTGRLSPENGVVDYWDPLPVPAAGGTAGRTIAHALRDRGYATAFFGKWHLAPRDRNAAFVGDTHARTIVPPERRGGFELWEGFEGGFLLNDPWLHGTRHAAPVHFKGYQADVLLSRAADWLRQRREAQAVDGPPVFCVVSLEPPHPPYHAPAPHVREMPPAEIRLRGNVPAGGPVEEQARSELAGYYAHVEATDRAVGRFLAEIDLGDTAVVFTSVHGDMHGSHGLFRKGWPHEESVRVPLLVRPAAGMSEVAGAQPGQASRLPVSLVDLPHLALAWAEGREWHLRRDSAPISLPAPPGIPRQCNRAWRGFRSEKHKVVLNADGSPWLFFDLEHDPLELQNLADDPARREELATLARWI